MGCSFVGESGMAAPLLTVAAHCHLVQPPYPQARPPAHADRLRIQSLPDHEVWRDSSPLMRGNVTQGHGIPDHQVFCGALHFSACGAATGVCPPPPALGHPGGRGEQGGGGGGQTCVYNPAPIMDALENRQPLYDVNGSNWWFIQNVPLEVSPVPNAALSSCHALSNASWR